MSRPPSFALQVNKCFLRMLRDVRAIADCTRDGESHLPSRRQKRSAGFKQLNSDAVAWRALGRLAKQPGNLRTRPHLGDPIAHHVFSDIKLRVHGFTPRGTPRHRSLRRALDGVRASDSSLAWAIRHVQAART